LSLTASGLGAVRLREIRELAMAAAPKAWNRIIELCGSMDERVGRKPSRIWAKVAAQWLFQTIYEERSN
jgi:hypothetical protein